MYRFCICFFVISIFTHCTYNVEEELYGSLDCDKIDMSYSQDILPIIENDCYVCHSAAANFGNVTLEEYDEIIKYIDDGTLIGSINHAAGFSPMPQGAAKLLECEIEKIESWIMDGAPNN